MFAPTLAEMVKEAEREVVLRKRVYPRWIASKKMKPATAERQIQVMEAIAATLAKLAAEESVQPR